MSSRKAKPRKERVTARITEEELLVLLFLCETTGKTTSSLLQDALQKTYKFDALLPSARDFFASREQLIAQTKIVA